MFVFSSIKLIFISSINNKQFVQIIISIFQNQHFPNIYRSFTSQQPRNQKTNKLKSIQPRRQKVYKKIGKQNSMIDDQLNQQCRTLTNSANLMFISNLMNKIEQTTSTMSDTFEQTILKHQEQFIKTYKIKIYQLTKLFHQLKKNIQDKFINNAITQQLQTVIKQRDYFKYQCLKLNTQYKNVLDDYKNLTQQMVNVSQQMNIYKHLLQNQKAKSSQIQKNAHKLKLNLTQLASKTIHDVNLNDRQKRINKLSQQQKQQITKLKKQVKEKGETIRALKQKIQEFDDFQQNKYLVQQQKKQLYEVFKICVESWKRQIISKSKKSSLGKYSSSSLLSPALKSSSAPMNRYSLDEFTSMQKKQLLKSLFTNVKFLNFIDKMLFDNSFQVRFIEIPDSFQDKNNETMIKNRNKLYQLMQKKGLVNSTANKPFKFR